jgi:peptidylprolyl isomerase
MARSASPNSANSQFFICFAPSPFLDGQYTVWGEVISGMDHVDKIKRGEPPVNPDKIISMKLGADAK